MRPLAIVIALLLSRSAPPVAVPSPSASAIGTAAPTLLATPTPVPSAAASGIEVFATGQLHGTYVWIVREEFAAQDRVTEMVYAVPLDGSPPLMALRRLRDRQDPGIIASRQISPDGTKLALEPPYLGPAAIDGLIVVDMMNGKIGYIARGDARADVMPAWSPDGTRIAYARSNPGATPVTRTTGCGSSMPMGRATGRSVRAAPTRNGPSSSAGPPTARGSRSRWPSKGIRTPSRTR